MMASNLERMSPTPDPEMLGPLRQDPVRKRRASACSVPILKPLANRSPICPPKSELALLAEPEGAVAVLTLPLLDFWATGPSGR